MVLLVLFSVTLAAESLAVACVTFSLLFPHRRIWPPPRPGAWQSRLMWLLFAASGAGIVALGLLDRGSFPFPLWPRWGLGGALWLAGSGLALWALATLGVKSSFGDEGPFIHRGPYRFSRNPQYVGFIAGLIGWGLAAGSLLTLLAALAGIAALVLAPFAEESWLAKLHGEAYEEYKRSAARFIGQLKD